MNLLHSITMEALAEIDSILAAWRRGPATITHIGASFANEKGLTPPLTLTNRPKSLTKENGNNSLTESVEVSKTNHRIGR